jgi:hypothetical protein
VEKQAGVITLPDDALPSHFANRGPPREREKNPAGNQALGRELTGLSTCLSTVFVDKSGIAMPVDAAVAYRTKLPIGNNDSLE